MSTAYGSGAAASGRHAISNSVADVGGQTYADDAGWRSSQTKKEYFRPDDLASLWRPGTVWLFVRRAAIFTVAFLVLDVVVHVLIQFFVDGAHDLKTAIHELTATSALRHFGAAAFCVFGAYAIEQRIRRRLERDGISEHRYEVVIQLPRLEGADEKSAPVPLHCLNGSFGSGQIQFSCGTRGLMIEGHHWANFIRWKKIADIALNPARSTPFLVYSELKSLMTAASSAAMKDGAPAAASAAPMSIDAAASKLKERLGNLDPAPGRIHVILYRYDEGEDGGHGRDASSEQIVIPKRFFYGKGNDGWRDFAVELAVHKFRSELMN